MLSRIACRLLYQGLANSGLGDFVDLVVGQPLSLLAGPPVDLTETGPRGQVEDRTVEKLLVAPLQTVLLALGRGDKPLQAEERGAGVRERAGAVVGAASVGEEQSGELVVPRPLQRLQNLDRKSTRLNSSHVAISYAVFCLKNKNITA